jgi:hypothetical protein
VTNHSSFGRSAPLWGLADELDPPRGQQQLARERYKDLGAWLFEYAGRTAGRDVHVYPQGSGNLGTTNRNPFTDEFDIDLVIRVAYAKHELSQQELNQLVNGWLGSYVSVRQAADHPLAPAKLEKGKRAWTLHYAGFHMDALAVVPDVDGELHAPMDVPLGDPSWLTDKALVRWQPTNPRGFGEWFRAISATERRERTAELAKRAGVEVDQLPEDRVKTTLQVTVQLLKRHRDYRFRDDPERLAPPSAVITALAAQAYQAKTPFGGELAEVIEAVVTDMPNHVHTTDAGTLWIYNPTCAKENYADRYKGNPDKEAALHGWLQQMQDDVAKVTTARDAVRVSEAIDGAFGPGLGPRVAKRIGHDTQELRARGALGSTQAGLLTAGAGGSHRPHEFYGQPPT